VSTVSKKILKEKLKRKKIWTVNIYPDLLPHSLISSGLLWTSGKFRCDCLSWTDAVVPFSFSTTPWVMDEVSIRADFLGYI